MPCCEQGEGLTSVAADPTTVPGDTPSPCPFVILLPPSKRTRQARQRLCEREKTSCSKVADLLSDADVPDHDAPLVLEVDRAAVVPHERQLQIATGSTETSAHGEAGRELRHWVPQCVPPARSGRARAGAPRRAGMAAGSHCIFFHLPAPCFNTPFCNAFSSAAVHILLGFGLGLTIARRHLLPLAAPPLSGEGGSCLALRFDPTSPAAASRESFISPRTTASPL